MARRTPHMIVSKSHKKIAGLRYVNLSSMRSGITRVRTGKGFSYKMIGGATLKSAADVTRVRKLGIPPAWTDVWICPHENGHIQAIGRDAKGRKQYIYHPRWRQVRDESKFGRLILFGSQLSRIRKRVLQDLELPGLPRDKVLATVVRLLETTLIRVGNEEYAKKNASYGLTTLQDRHAVVKAGSIHFSFKGKSGIKHDIVLNDPHLARIVKKCQDLPGQELFQYVNEQGNVVDITSTDVNKYLQDISGYEFTAKDFRTWYGTVLAAKALQEFESVDSHTQAKRNVMQAIEAVAKRLGNTKAICRKCYVFPGVVNAYLEGTLRDVLQRQISKELSDNLQDLSPEETAVLAFLYESLGRPELPKAA